MKSLFISLIIILSTNVEAARDQFEPFLNSLEKQLLLRADHLIDISPKIRLKKMGIFSPRNAEATYSPVTNTISLKKENLIKMGRQYRIKTYQEFGMNSSFNPFIVKAETIFHELAHADFDVYLEQQKHTEIHLYLTKKIPAWFKQHFRSYNSKTATHELFGYTAGNYIATMNNHISNTLLNHGLYQNQDKCFNQRGLEKIAKRLGLDKKLEFKDIIPGQTFTKNIIPRNIFINGKSLDLKNLPERFKVVLIQYFSQQYSLAKHTKELTEKLNLSYFSDRLKRCYTFLNTEV